MNLKPTTMAIKDLFNKPLKVVNTGLQSFSENIRQAGAEAVQLDWKPALLDDPALFQAIKNKKTVIDTANRKALDIVCKASPCLLGLISPPM